MFVCFLTLKKYVSAELDKTEMLMNLKKQNAINGNRILSRNIKYLEKKLKAFQNIVAIFKINSIDSSLFFCFFFRCFYM